MSVAVMKIIDAIVNLLETETLAIKAGQLSTIAETAERKARLMLQLSRAEQFEGTSGRPVAQMQSLQSALRSNLRVCRENIDAIKEIIELHLAVEREMENDGTYAIPFKLMRL